MRVNRRRQGGHHRGPTLTRSALQSKRWPGVLCLIDSIFSFLSLSSLLHLLCLAQTGREEHLHCRFRPTVRRALFQGTKAGSDESTSLSAIFELSSQSPIAQLDGQMTRNGRQLRWVGFISAFCDGNSAELTARTVDHKSGRDLSAWLRTSIRCFARDIPLFAVCDCCPSEYLTAGGPSRKAVRILCCSVNLDLEWNESQILGNGHLRLGVVPSRFQSRAPPLFNFSCLRYSRNPSFSVAITFLHGHLQDLQNKKFALITLVFFSRKFGNSSFLHNALPRPSSGALSILRP